MAHKTLIGGTAYEISGGKTLINGTAYSIKNGKTLIGGTVYEIGFGSNAPIILEVEKITSDTYAAETAYTGEQFILLDIYPKTNGTVSVTYGGLTKTITDTSGAAEPNAQQVFFGTFNGVSDSVATPASGELTIEGQYDSFASGAYSIKGQYKTETKYCGCITGVTDWGNIESIKSYAFRDCLLLTSINIPNSITYIGSSAFYKCTNLTNVTIGKGVTSIGSSAFNGCSSLTSVTIGNSVTSIGDAAFKSCTNLVIESLPNSITHISGGAFEDCTNLALTSLPNSLTMIGDSAFKNCTNLALTVFPHGLLDIGEYAFAMAPSSSSIMRTGVVLPSTIQYIGTQAFGFPSAQGSASNIGGYLEKIQILATVPPTIVCNDNSGAGSNGSFGWPSSFPFPIVVPKGCGNAYKTADVWSTYYADHIVEAS